jgi:TctA family transporter
LEGNVDQSWANCIIHNEELTEDSHMPKAEPWRYEKRTWSEINQDIGDKKVVLVPIGSTELMRGFDFLIAVIGLFGIGEILLTMEERLSFTGSSAKLNLKVVLETWAKLPKYWLTSLRSCIIGCWMGITPGGATPASFMSYGIAKRVAKKS